MAKCCEVDKISFLFLFEKFLAYLPHPFFVITRNVNGKVLHDSMLSSHWMKVRNRHKNENFALQKVVQSRHWISAFGTLCHCSRNQRSRTTFKMNYGCVAFKGFINSFQSTHPLCNQIKKIMSEWLKSSRKIFMKERCKFCIIFLMHYLTNNRLTMWKFKGN